MSNEEHRVSRIRRLGELAGEASVLILVFGMLDIFFHEPALPETIPLAAWALPALALVMDLHTRRIYVLPWVLFVCLSSGLTLVVSMWLEYRKGSK